VCSPGEMYGHRRMARFAQRKKLYMRAGSQPQHARHLDVWPQVRSHARNRIKIAWRWILKLVI
jgi:hypothetical protein